MYKHFYLSSLILILFSFSLKAQNHDAKCGFDKLYHRQMEVDSEAKDIMLNFEQKWQNRKKNPQLVNSTLLNDTIYEIPVVFHIIHPNAPVGSNFNPSDATIDSLMDYVNKTFAATWNAYPDENNGGTKINIKFTLAKRDPNCNPTTGIVRINANSALPANLVNEYVNNGVNYSTNLGINDIDLKNLSRWDHRYYYNIWVVNKIDGWSGYDQGTGFVGYAYYPGASADVDGTVIMEAYNKAGQSTLPHELGHALSLIHTFEGGCASTADCATTGDLICDTDPHDQTTGCPSGNNPCTNTSWSPVKHNFMNYTYCPDRFSTEQGERAKFALLNLRESLLRSLGAVALGQDDINYTPPTNAQCIPYIPESNTFEIGCSYLEINGQHYKSPRYPRPESIEYVDYTGLNCTNYPFESFHLEAGQSYNIYTEHYFNNQNTKIWIDFNNDGVMTENEVFYHSYNTNRNTTQENDQVHYFEGNSITVPENAVKNTPLRMRIINEYYTVQNPTTSCGNIAYGKAVDLTAIIDSEEISIKENHLSSSFEIYPNPFDDFIQIKSNDRFSGSLKVINILGQEVFFQDNVGIEAGNSIKILMNENELKSNLYHLMLVDEKGNIMHKKMIKK